MSSNISEPSNRAVTIIALLQFGVVIGGTLFVGAMMKAFGYQQGYYSDDFFRPIAIFIREYGFTLLLLPIIWAALALFVTLKSSNPLFPWAVITFGIAAVLFGIFWYYTLGFSARELGIRKGPAPPKSESPHRR